MYATVADVEVDNGAPIPADQVAMVEALIERAEEQVRQAVPDLDARIAAGRTSEILVRQVICEMVSDVVVNPTGVRAKTETVGPFSQTVSYGGQYSANNDSGLGRLVLSKRHLKLLGQRQGAVTIPNGDPALRYPVRDPADRWEPGRERFGYLWPGQTP